MPESVAIGIRVENDFLGKIETIGKKEHLDRSTTMRMLMEKGYSEYVKKKAAQEYVSGKITISKAAEKAELTIWEMEKYLVEEGFRTEYSIEDLKEEIKKLEKK